jgi:DNA-binding LacI/PurR family transcriptional regulator
MRDVAARAEVSPATVSLVLRRSPLISAATQARVLEAARLLGYRPNPFVQSLMRTRRRRGEAALGPVIAFVTAHGTRDGWRRDPTPVFRQMFDGARRRAEECGYRLEEFWLREPGMSEARFCAMLHARGIHGLLLAPLPEPNAALTLDWENFATVALGFTLVHPGVHRVSNDHFHSLVTAFTECQRLGYQRIGLALSETVNDKVQRRWLAAFLLSQHQAHHLPALSPLVLGKLTEPAFRAWFEAERPDVIIAPAPQLLREWLQGWGMRVPDDVGLASLSSPRLGDALSGICQNGEQLGRRSIDLLVTALERNELGLPALPDVLLVDGAWNPGATVMTQSLVARVTTAIGMAADTSAVRANANAPRSPGATSPVDATSCGEPRVV